MPDTDRYPADKVWISSVGALVATLEEVQQNFARYGLFDDQVRFVKGWFRDTLPTAPITRLAVLRLDGDLYESTILTLKHLYPKLSVGGFAIIDDYHYESCRAAVDDYRAEHEIQETVVDIDGRGAYWRKEK
jgi:O-methyltransferase